MAKAKKTATLQTVTAYIQASDHPLAGLMEALRQLILSTDKEIGEQIKWNAPSFWYMGEMKPFDPKEYKRDIVVFNLHKPEYILLVFPTGAKVINTSGVLEGSYKDGRRLVTIRTREELKAKGPGIQQVIKEWLQLVEK